MSTRDDVLQHVQEATDVLALKGITEQMREDLFGAKAVKVLLQQTYDKFTNRVEEICGMVPEKYKGFASQLKDSLLESSKPEDYMEAVKFQFWITVADFINQKNCDEATVSMVKADLQEPAEMLGAIEVLANNFSDYGANDVCGALIQYMDEQCTSEEEWEEVKQFAANNGYTCIDLSNEDQLPRIVVIEIRGGSVPEED